MSLRPRQIKIDQQRDETVITVEGEPRLVVAAGSRDEALAMLRELWADAFERDSAELERALAKHPARPGPS